MDIQSADSRALGHAFLIPMDAERHIESLEKMELHQIGTQEWIEQYEKIELLNLQAHHCAQSNSDNFVIENLVTFDKIETIIYNLFVLEVWKKHILPQLSKNIRQNHAMRIYFIMYHEATLCNLLEIALYHEHVVASCPDSILELIDYCMIRIQWLITMSNKEKEMLHTSIQWIETTDNGNSTTKSKYTFHNSNEQESHKQTIELNFQIGVICMTILRYIAEHLSNLPLSLMTRMLDTHEMILTLIQLIEFPPWTYYNPDTKIWKKFIDHKWKKVLPDDLLQLTSIEGQPWICLYHLLCQASTRQGYQFKPFHQVQLGRIRKYLNDILIDQLPILTDVQRYLDQLTISGQTSNVSTFSTSSNSLIMETIPILRESLVKNQNWNEHVEIIETQIFSLITSEDDEKDMKRLALLYQTDGIEDLLGEPPIPTTFDEKIKEKKDWKPMQVILSFSTIDNTKEFPIQFHFEIDQTSEKIMTNKQGKYKRYSLKSPQVFNLHKEMIKYDESNQNIPIPSNNLMKMQIKMMENTNSIENSNEKIQEIEDSNTIDLPCTQISINDICSKYQIVEISRDLPLKQWKQIGTISMKSKFILQVLFQRLQETSFHCDWNDQIETYVENFKNHEKKQYEFFSYTLNLSGLYLSMKLDDEEEDHEP